MSLLLPAKNEIGKPPDGAGLVSTTVPITPEPPGTDGGLSESALTFGARIVRVAAAGDVDDSPKRRVLLVPSAIVGARTELPANPATICIETSAATEVVLIVNVVDEPPAGTFTVAGIDTGESPG